MNTRPHKTLARFTFRSHPATVQKPIADFIDRDTQRSRIVSMQRDRLDGDSDLGLGEYYLTQGDLTDILIFSHSGTLQRQEQP